MKQKTLLLQNLRSIYTRKVSKVKRNCSNPLAVCQGLGYTTEQISDKYIHKQSTQKPYVAFQS